MDETEKGLFLAECEERLVEIWTEVLNHTTRRADDFLEQGGDSLSAMLCISRIRKEFGVDVPLLTFFIEPATVSSLAVTIHDLLHGHS